MTTDYQHLVSLLTETFEISPGEIRDDASLAEMGLDSLAAAELHVRLQDHYGAHASKGAITEKMSLHQVVTVLRGWRGEQETNQVNEVPQFPGELVVPASGDLRGAPGAGRRDPQQSAPVVGEDDHEQTVAFVLAGVVLPVLLPGSAPGTDYRSVQQYDAAAHSGDLLQGPVQARGAGGDQADGLPHPSGHGRAEPIFLRRLRIKSASQFRVALDSGRRAV